MDVLQGRCLDGELKEGTPHRNLVWTYGGWPISELIKIHEIFSEQYCNMFGEYPNLDAREIIRICSWVDKQRKDPKSRITGEKLRIKNPRHKMKTKRRNKHSAQSGKLNTVRVK